MHSARVDYRVIDLQDTYNQIFIYCPECDSEWGWCYDIRGTGNYDRLEVWVDEHNAAAST